MSRLWLVCASTVLFSSQALAAPAPCVETDLRCVLRLLDEKNQETKSWARENGLLKAHIQLLTDENGLLRADSEALREASTRVLEAAKAVKPSVFEHPALLISVGVVGGVLLTVFAIWGVGQLRLPAAAMPAQ